MWPNVKYGHNPMLADIDPIIAFGVDEGKILYFSIYKDWRFNIVCSLYHFSIGRHMEKKLSYHS